MILLGSLVNAGAIVVGGLIGMFAGKLLPERLRADPDHLHGRRHHHR